MNMKLSEMRYAEEGICEKRLLAWASGLVRNVGCSQNSQ